MIFEVKKEDKTYIVDDLKPFHQQRKAFQQAFNKADNENLIGVTISHFDNADAILYIESDRLLITLNENENENN